MKDPDPRDDVIPEPGNVTRHTDDPRNRLERIGAAMTAAARAHPEHQHDDRYIAFLDGDGFSGIVMSGYEGDQPDRDAMVDLLLHLRAMFRANGKDLQVIAL